MPAATEIEEWYLGSGNGAHSAEGDGVLLRKVPAAGSDSFVYDPDDPVPTRGGPHCCTANPNDQPGSFDQSESAKRQDVLVFNSEVMSNPMTIVGPAMATAGEVYEIEIGLRAIA